MRQRVVISMRKKVAHNVRVEGLARGMGGMQTT